MKRVGMLAIAISFSLQLFAAELLIVLPLQKQILKYPQQMRLSQVLMDAHALVPNYYPLGLFLSDPMGESKLVSLQTEIRGQLETRINKPNYDDLNLASKTIKVQLSRFEYSSRKRLRLDYDWARAQPMRDPVLRYANDQNHQFKLYAYPRPNHINLIGAVDRPGELEFHAHWQLVDYLSNNRIQLLDGANKTQAFVIQPDGEVEELGYGWWNKHETYLAPGAIVFIGLSSLWNENDSLNRQIANLLVHRVPQ